MTSADLYKSFLAKGKFVSGVIENAETIDGLDADMTGDASKGKSTSAPASADDREAEDKKVKKKVTKNDKNGGPTQSVESTVGYEQSMAGKESKFNDVGPYDFSGEVTNDVTVPASGPLIDGYILRSEQVAEMMKSGAGLRGGEVTKDTAGDPLLCKGGEGSRGGKVIGHTKSGKAVYDHAHAMYNGGRGPMDKHTKGWSHQDHVDAKDLHDADSEAHRDNAAVASWEHEGLTGESGYRSGHHDRSGGADQAATMHRMWARKTNKSMKASDMAESWAYVGGDAKSDLEKGGEGSRGGKVIGHTKSGKAVYDHAHGMYGNAGSLKKQTKGWSHQDHKDAESLHDDAAMSHGRDAGVASWEHEGLTGEKGYRGTHHGKSDGADRAALMHKTAAYFTNKSTKAGDMAKSWAYVGGDAKTYQQRVEQRGFISVVTGGMDSYLAHLSKGDAFYANGTNHHTPQDENSVGQTLCKSCDQQHSALYGVCPHCGPGHAMTKSHAASQDHRYAFSMPGREQGSSLVDMSAFRLED